jgi:hypothetical protein
MNGESPINLDWGLKCFGQSHDLGMEYEQEKKGDRAEAPSQEHEAGHESS